MLADDLPRVRAWHDLDRPFHAAQARFTTAVSPASLLLAYADWALHMANAPFRQVELAQSALHQWFRLTDAVMGKTVISPAPQDRRFASAAWQDPPYKALYQAFLLAEEWCAQASDAGPAVARHNANLVAFTNRQILDAFAPSNNPVANPDIVRTTLATGGANLLAGMRNLLADKQRAHGGQHDDAMPVVGREVAATAGQVVFRNELIELIQYAPATSTVCREPVLIVPAWIMKYYILDLSPENSLVRYLVGQGHTVFAISWRNPGVAQQTLSLDDYRRLGPLAALQAINAIIPNVPVHAAGYCLGGTLLTITAAAMARDIDQRLASVSLLAAQTDFTDAGELQLFISEGQLAYLEDVMSQQGYLDSSQMAGAFQMLRTNDLIWSRIVNDYWLGRQDTPNDLMAWNADATRMPSRMHAEYLRKLFLDNDLAEGRFVVDGAPISLADIKQPFFVVGTENDHVAPWRSVYKIRLLNPGETTFVLTNGGHNAGIVSEPGHAHRHYRLQKHEGGALYTPPDQFLAEAPSIEGSWWTAWSAWLRGQSGEMVKPPPMGAANKGFALQYPAPGHYVLEK